MLIITIIFILIKFSILLLTLTLMGKTLYQLLVSKTEDILANSYKITHYASYLIIGLGFALVTSHLLSFITQSFRTSLKIMLPIFLVIAAVSVIKFLKNKNRNWLELIKFTKVELFLLAFLTYLAYLYVMMDDFILGCWDKIHHCYVASIMENNFYPPAEPTDISQVMDYYHYGVDLIAGAFSHYLGIELWHAYALQLALFVCLLMVFLFSIINLYIPNAALVLFLTIFTFFFSSLTNFEFLVRYTHDFSHFGWERFIEYFRASSYLSAKNLSTRMAFYSPNIGFGMSFTVLFFLLVSLQFKEVKNYLKYLILFLCSFLLYFGEPSMWYPFFGALVIYTGSIFLLNINSSKDIKTSIQAIYPHIFYIASFFLGKLVCFNRHISNFNGINLFRFELSQDLNIPLSWGTLYEKLFFAAKLKNYQFMMSSHFQYVKVPLFSEIGFREIIIFVLISFIGLVLIWTLKKKPMPVVFIFLTAFLGFLVPFFFEYSIRPEEDLRFIIFCKPFFTLAAVLAFFGLCNNFNNFFSGRKLIIIALMAFNISPVIYLTMICVGQHESKLVVTEEQSKFIKGFRKYHKSGETCLDDSLYIGWAGTSTLAGCYGLGYKLYRENKKTRETALKTMNPALLKELNIDYIVITNYDKLSPKAQERLKDSKFFTEVKIDDTLSWHVYKFNKHNFVDDPSYHNEYVWGITSVHTDGSTLLAEYPNHHKLVSDDRKILLSELKLLKDEIKDRDVEFTVWGAVEAFQMKEINP